MQINRNNYEIFFLDYRENNLSPQQVAELMVFLEENPDLKFEFEEFEEITIVVDESISFNNKSLLKKKQVIPYGSIDTTNFEEKLIANNEGDLSGEEEKNFAGFIGLNPELKLEVNALRLAVLKPDSNIVYDDKEGLKKYPFWIAYRTTLYYAASIAAIFILMIGFYFSFYNPQTEMIVEGQPGYIQKQDYLSLEINKSLPLRIESRNEINYASTTIKNESYVPVEVVQPIQLIKSRSVKLLSITQSQNNNLAFRFNEFVATDDQLEDPEELLATNSDRRKNFISSFLGNLTSKLIRRNNASPNNKKSSFIEYSVQGYNLLTDKEVEVKREYNENGDIMAYNVIGERVEFTTKKRKPSQE